MGTYRKEWACCGSVTETQAWEPESCPFCTPSTPSQAWEGELPELPDFKMACEQGALFFAKDMEAYARKAIGAAVAGVLEQAAQVCERVNNHDNPMTARDCADAIRSLRSNPVSPAKAAGWISVEERLPEVGTWCNVLVDRELGDYFDRQGKSRFSVYGAQLREIDGEGYAYWQRWQMADGGPMGSLMNVSHWMPLPAAPHPVSQQDGEKGGEA